MELIYQPKDMLFNNGIINLYRFLKANNIDDIELELTNDYLRLNIDRNKSKKVYFQILEFFLKDFNIVSFHPKNKRIFFDLKQKRFCQTHKVNIKGGGSNDSKNALIRVHIDDLSISKEKLLEEEKIYLAKNDNSTKDDFKISKCYYDKSKKEIYVLSTIDEHINKYAKFLVKSDLLVLNSSIHSFEDGQGSFHDMVKQPKNYKIDKWEALIYWFGGRVQRFYNYYYFIYPNSSNLQALEKFKEFLKIDDENIKIRDKKGELKTIGTNIDFYKRLSADGIYNQNFYISNSEEEFEVKFFMYLFLIIYHIEEQYEKANKRRKATRKEIYDALQQISFVVYTDDGTFKTSFSEYTKAYQLIKFFELLKENALFDYLADVLVTFSMSQGGKEFNLNLQRWCQNLLNFSSLRREYYMASFNILKNDSKSFGKKLFNLEAHYLKKLLGGKNMNIHEQSKKLGDGIGHYCAELGDKDLLFKLRNVKNYKQLIAYFKDLKFSILKNEDKAKFSKEFNDTLSETLADIEPNWEIMRDYIAIYAIDKYRTVAYAKSNQGEK